MANSFSQIFSYEQSGADADHMLLNKNCSTFRYGKTIK